MLHIFFNFFEHSKNSTYEKVALEDLNSKYLQWFEETELEIFNWSEASRAARVVVQRLREVRVFAADLNPFHLNSLPPVPLSVPFVQRIPPFSVPVGLGGLLDLVDN